MHAFAGAKLNKIQKPLVKRNAQFSFSQAVIFCQNILFKTVGLCPTSPQGHSALDPFADTDLE